MRMVIYVHNGACVIMVMQDYLKTNNDLAAYIYGYDFSIDIRYPLGKRADGEYNNQV